MVSIRIKSNKKLLNQLNEFSIDFIFGIDTNANTVANKTIKPQTGSFVDNFRNSTIVENVICHDEVSEWIFADRNRKEVENAVTAV